MRHVHLHVLGASTAGAPLDISVTRARGAGGIGLSTVTYRQLGPFAIALLIEPGHTHSPFRLERGELCRYFEDWEILHYREGRDQWRHAVAEIIVRKPMLILDP